MKAQPQTKDFAVTGKQARYIPALFKVSKAPGGWRVTSLDRLTFDFLEAIGLVQLGGFDNLGRVVPPNRYSLSNAGRAVVTQWEAFLSNFNDSTRVK